MNKLDAIRLSDKPGDVVHVERHNLFIFSKGERKFTVYSGGEVPVIAVLAPYNRDTVHDYPRTDYQPGGYAIERFIPCESLDHMRQFIAETLAI